MADSFPSLASTADTSALLSMYKLLSQLSSLPCSSGAAALLSSASSDNKRYVLALDVLLPVSQNQDFEQPQRILAAYALYAIYHSHEYLNAFYGHLLRVFESERAIAISRYRMLQLSGPSESRMSSREPVPRPQAENEQLIWVLWKILKGEGGDLAPYSPNILSRAELPGHLRSISLVLDSSQNQNSQSNLYNQYSSVLRNPRQPTPTTYRDQFPHLEQMSKPASLAPPSISISPFASSQAQSSSSSSSSPSPYSLRTANNSLDDEVNTLNTWTFEGSQNDHQTQSSDLRTFSMSSKPHEPVSQSIYGATREHRRETLLRTLCAGPTSENISQSYDGDPLAGRSSSNGFLEPLPRQQTRFSPSLPVLSSPSVQTSQNEPASLDNSSPSLYARPHNTTISQSYPTPIAQSYPTPIARPRPTTSLSNPSTSQENETRRNDLNFQFDTAGRSSLVYRSSPVDKNLQQTQHTTQTGFPQRIQPTSATYAPPISGPGVIGSGRPSSGPTSPVGSDTSSRRLSQNVGVIGIGRPAHRSQGTPQPDPVSTPNMLPYYAGRTEQSGDFVAEGGYGVIGRPKRGPTEVGGTLADDTAADAWSTSREIDEENISMGSRSQRPPLRVNVNDDKTPWDIPLPSSAEKDTMPSSFTVQLDDTPSRSLSSMSQNASSQAQYPSASFPSQNRRPTPEIEIDSFSSTSRNSNRAELSRFPVTATDTDVSIASSKPEVDAKERDQLSNAIVLLLSARERVLSLQEQRALVPRLPILSRPLSLLQPGDIPSLVANNPDVAAKLLVLLLDREDEEGVRIERISQDVGMEDLENPQRLADFLASPSFRDVQNIMQLVADVDSLSLSAAGQDSVPDFGGRGAKEGYLEALRRLPPTRQSFNLIAALLRPANLDNSVGTSDSPEKPEVRVARLVNSEVLGGFMNGCIYWVDKAEEEQKTGEVFDDRVAISVSGLCRFYSSLLKHGFVHAESEVDTTEIMSFSLQYSRFEEARSLYSTLAAARV